MILTWARPGEMHLICQITGKDEVRRHLAELGFVVDARVSVVAEMAGNLIIQVQDSRIALDKTIVNRIMVKEDEYEDTERSQDRRHRHGPASARFRCGQAPHHGHGGHQGRGGLHP